jgi:hypothetical protein
MSLKKLGLVAMAVAALFAIFAGSSSAATALKTESATWNTSSGGVKTAFPEAGIAPKCSAAENLKLTGKILTFEAELTATGVSCSGTLKNQTVEGSPMAVGTGTLTFSGITVNKPSGCKLNGEANGSAKLTTESLNIAVDMHATEPGAAVTPIPVVTFKPAATNFTKIKLTGCAAEGSYPVTGTAVGEASNATGTPAKNQPLTFNATTNAAGTLTLAGNPANLFGKANNELSTGQEFQVN